MAGEKGMLESLTESKEIKLRTQAEQESLTIDEYLDLVMEKPSVLRTAHQVINDVIDSKGHSDVDLYLNVPITRYHFFDDLPFLDDLDAQTRREARNGPDAIFGIDRQLRSLKEYFEAAAHSLGQEKRLLLLHGPVGSAKSTIARLLKKSMETDSLINPRFTYEFVNLDGLSDLKVNRRSLENRTAPMLSDPLTLFPPSSREKLRDQVNTKIAALKDSAKDGGYTMRYFLKQIRESDPLSVFYVDALTKHYKGDMQKALREHVRVRRLIIDEKRGMGIGTFEPKDEKNQDSTELTGMVDLGRVAVYGQKDPRAFAFEAGELCKGNRGIVELIEVLKLDVAFLYTFLTATQEQVIKPKGFPQIPVDEVLIGHTNEAEYLKLKDNKFMEALKSRTTKIDIPYILRLSDEVKIYERDYGKPEQTNGKHVCKHSHTAAGIWSMLTRYEPPKEKAAQQMTLLEKMRLYDGRKVPGYAQDIVLKLHRDAKREGLEGIGPRLNQNAYAMGLVAEQKTCLTPFHLLKYIESQLKEESNLTEEQRTKYLKFGSDVEGEMLKMFERDVHRAAIADTERKDRIAQKYFTNLVGYVMRQGVPDERNPDNVVEPDNKFLSSIEKFIGISKETADDFRRQVVLYFGGVGMQGLTRNWKEFKTITDAFDYRKHEQLDEAFDLYLFSLEKHSFDFSTVYVGTRTQADQRVISTIIDRMVGTGNYCQVCASDVLSYVAKKHSQKLEMEQKRV